MSWPPFRSPSRQRKRALPWRPPASGSSPTGSRRSRVCFPRSTSRCVSIYGGEDRILPDIAETMARVKRDVPQAEVTSLPGCGHFLQEEEPQEIGDQLARFFAA